MDIGEEQAPIELPLPATPEAAPDQEEHPGRSGESKPEPTTPAEPLGPEKVPA